MIDGLYVYNRAAQLQALQAPANYYQQTPLQQTGFYQAQQTGSTLQVAIDWPQLPLSN